MDQTAKHAALLYVRTRTRADTPAVQFHALRQLSALRGWRVAGEFLDLPTDGCNRRDSLLAEIHRGVHPQGGALVCASLSSLTTGSREAVSILHGLLARGWNLVTIDGTDTTETTNIASLIASLAALDRAGVAERARAALDQARREGRQLGRKRIEIPFEKVHALLDAGRSWREIARVTGISVATLHRAMRSHSVAITTPLSIAEAA